jgi:hypothetical protein
MSLPDSFASSLRVGVILTSPCRHRPAVSTFADGLSKSTSDFPHYQTKVVNWSTESSSLCGFSPQRDLIRHTAGI